MLFEKSLLDMHSNILLFLYIHSLARQSALLDAFFIAITSYSFLLLWCVFQFGYLLSRSKSVTKMIGLGVALIGTWMITFFLKILIAEPRPFVVIDHIVPLLPQQAALTAPDWSFPSGHATVAFALATIFTIAKTTFRQSKAMFYTAIILYFCAVLVAFSRVYVGVHFPIDVICGAIIGTLAPWGISLLIRKYAPAYIALRLKKV